MLLVALSFLGLMLAQGPVDLFQKAPPEVDEALRARVSKFYQAHVDGKFRLADQYVAEDSKDYFFEAQKPRYKNFELSRILYSEDFTRAKVTVICGTEMLIPLGGMKLPAKVPLTTTWKQVDGQWYWYYDANQPTVTPWGTMKPGPEPKGGASSGGLPPPPLPKDKEMAALAQMLKVDKTQVQLPADSAGSAEVTISHRMPGSLMLSLEAPPVDGLELKLDRKEVKAGETAHLTIRYDPPAKGPKQPAVILLHVDPLNDVIPIRLTFTESGKH